MATITMTEKHFQVSEEIDMQQIRRYVDGKDVHNPWGPLFIYAGLGCAFVLGCVAGDAFFFIGIAIVVVGIIYNIMWKKKHAGVRLSGPYDAAVWDFIERYRNTPEGMVEFTVNPGENVVPASLCGYMTYNNDGGYRYGLRGDFFHGSWCVYTRMAVYEDRLAIAQDDFHTTNVNERGIRRLCFEIPFSEIAFMGVQSFNVTTNDCSAEAVPVRYLRIQSNQGENFDFPCTEKDDTDTLIALVNDLING